MDKDKNYFPAQGYADGISIRDKIAFEAMKIIIKYSDKDDEQEIAEDAYKMADAMIERSNM